MCLESGLWGECLKILRGGDPRQGMERMLRVANQIAQVQVPRDSGELGVKGREAGQTVARVCPRVSACVSEQAGRVCIRVLAG